MDIWKKLSIVFILSQIWVFGILIVMGKILHMPFGFVLLAYFPSAIGIAFALILVGIRLNRKKPKG
jgi:hypothetical protein